MRKLNGLVVLVFPEYSNRLPGEVDIIPVDSVSMVVIAVTNDFGTASPAECQDIDEGPVTTFFFGFKPTLVDGGTCALIDVYD